MMGSGADDGSNRLNDKEIVKLAEAERDAGVPDIQTAAAATEAKERAAATTDDGEAEAHPS